MRVRPVIRGIVALLMATGVLLLAACGSNSSDDFQTATADELANRSFSFANGAVFGLPNEAATLTFGDFNSDGDSNSNTGPFSLASERGTATGTVTVGSCNLAISASTFDAIALSTLQVGRSILLDPCAVAVEDNTLQVRNQDSGIEAVSNSPTPAGGGVGFVLTGDFSTGSYSVVDLATRNLFDDIGFGAVSSDALARTYDGLVYVVNRSDGNIQVIDPRQGFTTVTQVSVGDNPQDIVFVGGNRAYVSRLSSDELLIVDATTLAAIGAIDLSSLTKPADLDGVPDPFRMLLHNGLVYLILQHLDFSTGFIPERVAPGEIVVIDPALDEIVKVIALNGTDPFTDLQFSPDLNRILVASIGNFAVADGGIEAIDPETNTVDTTFVVSEAALGGDITHFEVLSSTQGYAIVTDTNFAASLVRFNPSTGEVLGTLFGPVNVFVPHFAINSRNELYLAVADATVPTPQVIVFDTERNVELTRIPSGELPPLFVLFIEE